MKVGFTFFPHNAQTWVTISTCKSKFTRKFLQSLDQLGHFLFCVVLDSKAPLI